MQKLMTVLSHLGERRAGGGPLARPGQDERLDLAKRPHVLDRLVDAIQGVSRGQHRLEVVARARAAHELEGLPELPDIGRLHAEHCRLLADEERGLDRREWSTELANDGVAPARAKKVEAFGERVRR